MKIELVEAPLSVLQERLAERNRDLPPGTFNSPRREMEEFAPASSSALPQRRWPRDETIERYPSPQWAQKETSSRIHQRLAAAIAARGVIGAGAPGGSITSLSCGYEISPTLIGSLADRVSDACRDLYGTQPAVTPTERMPAYVPCGVTGQVAGILAACADGRRSGRRRQRPQRPLPGAPKY